MYGFDLQFIDNAAEEDEGLGHAGIETYKDAPYASVARECGQNSSDARRIKPVELQFDLITVPVNEIPAFDQLCNAVQACRERAESSGDEKGIDFFSRADRLLKADALEVLRISDCNTLGLEGPCQPGTAFHSLVKGSGVSKKDSDTSGGSFGIGKNAVFTISELQTVFYSTIYKDPSSDGEAFLAQGKSILISHTDKDGEPKKATGYWGGEGFGPIADENSCPEWMRRSEQGTSIFALGFRHSPTWHYRIAASLVRNFYAAIHRKEMRITINGGKLLIDSETLPELFRDGRIKDAAEESGHLDDLDFSSHLYDCLVSTEAREVVKKIEGLGNVRIRLLVKEGLPKRVAIVRNGMMITETLEHFGDKFKTFPLCRDFVALIEPDDDNGSALIKRLENPRHDGLSAERLSDQSKRDAATKAIKALARAIREHIKEHTQVPLEQVTAINELAEFFSDVEKNNAIPEAQNEKDPETYTYAPKKRKRMKLEAPTSSNGLEGGAGGNKENEGSEGGGQGTGTGPGSGGRGECGRRVVLELFDQRNKLPDTSDLTRRTLFFTPAESGTASISINVPGMALAERLPLAGASRGQVSHGRLIVEVSANHRETVDVVFSEPYEGPIDIVALIDEKGGESDAA